MPDWLKYLKLVQTQAARVPMLGWAVAGVVVVSLAVMFFMEMAGPPYVALYDGLSPADGGKVIAQLQKLSIPYQLEAAGNIILVPAPLLASARLQMGAAQVPQTDTSAAWEKVEDAPMTASDLAQNTMATQALEGTLAQSINGINGISNAQVFIAVPPDTPFLADQPKTTASVQIDADAAAAAAQGPAIAALVAGAVPGLAAASVSVETTSGISVYPVDKQAQTGAQLAIIAQVENTAAARVAVLLSPIVGNNNFRTDVSANVDFTAEQIHQISYGPSQLLSHVVTSKSTRPAPVGSASGIPGAMSNEPPPATTAIVAAAAGSAAQPAAPASASPQDVNTSADSSYVSDQSESDIVKPDWAVQSIAVSVVLNDAAMNGVSIDQIKAAIAGAFSYQHVTVNVLAVDFRPVSKGAYPVALVQSTGPVSRALLQVLAAVAVLFGVALPMGKRFGAIRPAVLAVPAVARPVAMLAPRPDFTGLREQAVENVVGVARLLQNWAEDGE